MTPKNVSLLGKKKTNIKMYVISYLLSDIL